MFGLLNSSQIYGIQQQPTEKSNNITTNGTAAAQHKTQQRRSSSNVSDTTKESNFLATLSSAATQGMKSPTNFIEKFIKSELLNGYDTIKNYKNFHQSSKQSTPGVVGGSGGGVGGQHTAGGVISSLSCVHGSYRRSSGDGDFYEAVNVAQRSADFQKHSDSEVELTATAMRIGSSGASSGEFNSDSTTTTTATTTTTTRQNTTNISSSTNNLFKKMQRRSLDALALHGNANEVTSDNSSSSISTTTNSSTSSHNTSTKSNDLHRSSSSASSGIARTITSNHINAKERKNGAAMLTQRSSPETATSSGNSDSALLLSGGGVTSSSSSTSAERLQRRKLLHMISNYDQQNKLLQRELAKEKRRRSEELACVVKSLLCFESKLKTDMKSVNQRLFEKDAEICRLVRQNRALRLHLQKAREREGDNARDEGVEEDGDVELSSTQQSPQQQINEGKEEQVSDEEADCLMLEALQCMSCRKQFYDIDDKEGRAQSSVKDVGRSNDGHTTELGSSSDDTVSSSFYGARRSVRYTSKRTAGTFRDYMRSRSMHIDDDVEDGDALPLENINAASNTSLSGREIHSYSRSIERMHGVKSGGDAQPEARSLSRASSKSSGSSKSCSSNKSSGSNKSNSSKSSAKSTAAEQIEEDDGIFSPTQDEDFDEEDDDAPPPSLAHHNYKPAKYRIMEFSEASPQQVYETSTDDWYASASDQEESAAAPTAYAQNAVNPVLECVNQILLQQSMMLEEPHSMRQPSNELLLLSPAPTVVSNLPRRSSLSGRRSSRSNSHSSDGQNSHGGTLTRKRVHFSNKNSMVHVPRNDDHDDDDHEHDTVTAEEQQALVGIDNDVAVARDFEAAPRVLNTSHILSGLPTADTTAAYHSMHYYAAQTSNTTPNAAIYAARLDTLNYESIYSNEYERIGSEHNSNLYVDMEASAKLLNVTGEGNTRAAEAARHKLFPPALPPKPANLLKFKKSLQQLDEMPDEHLQQEDLDIGGGDNDAISTTNTSEPDYCSISEVNMGGGGVIRSVQIVADVHKPPDSDHELEQSVVVASMGSDDVSSIHKTDDIEEILADIPKLPNVAAIISPKQLPKLLSSSSPPQNDHYLLMSPATQTAARRLTEGGDFLLNSPRAMRSAPLDRTALTLQLCAETSALAAAARQYKRKHVPNILAEINKRMHNSSAPNSPSTSKSIVTPSSAKLAMPTSTPPMSSLPLLHAEFDWYNLDAEYGKATHHHTSAVTPDILKVADHLSGGVSLLAEIQEDHESVVSGADEYNLDAEFSLCGDRPDMLLSEEQEEDDDEAEDELELAVPPKLKVGHTLATICEAVNFPLFSESSPQATPAQPTPPTTKASAKKMKNNLANFEKFIEGSGLSTKTLPGRRKVYFAGPFV